MEKITYQMSQSDQTNHGASLPAEEFSDEALDGWMSKLEYQFSQIENDLARLSRAFAQRLEREREQ